ncbi:hypothetical protein AKJ16_DCAP15610 [Drosera capensis]
MLTPSCSFPNYEKTNPAPPKPTQPTLPLCLALRLRGVATRVHKMSTFLRHSHLTLNLPLLSLQIPPRNDKLCCFHHRLCDESSSLFGSILISIATGFGQDRDRD